MIWKRPLFWVPLLAKTPELVLWVADVAADGRVSPEEFRSILARLEAAPDQLARDTLVEQVDQERGMSEPLTPAEGSVQPFSFDQADFPLSKRPKRKWYNRPRRVDEVTHWYMHVTGLKRGFGVAPYQVTPWRRRYDRRVDMHGLPIVDAGEGYRWAPEGFTWSVHPASEEVASQVELREHWARTMALLDRFMSTPYHLVSQQPTSILVKNLPATCHSWHGNGGNRHGLAFALDGYGETVEDLDGDDLEHDVREGLEWARAQGCPLTATTFHSCHSAQRSNDPPPRVTKRVWELLGDLGAPVDRSWVTGTGKPVADRFMPGGVR